ncbi:uncharacterized protein UV8b_03043 [Ustilaginoidea virens]|uniref:Uncharacterized protein n=1 Tax=Ustilaginoidea virens TaxID=1159556 RepID=A0A8E5MGR0_USTVR|nr:uncharacterized protein UV8b_03043 [Ustilaginoidea virens]QUC18802.1 hypothetical protein UV8b_03043 [Ustilaginoidea virens]
MLRAAHSSPRQHDTQSPKPSRVASASPSPSPSPCIKGLLDLLQTSKVGASIQVPSSVARCYWDQSKTND